MHVDELIGLSFELITEWITRDDKIALRALDWPEHGGWLYAFVVDHEVKYIGLTNRVLRSRMDNYRDAKHSQTTRLRDSIRAELQVGRVVRVYGRKEPDTARMITEEARLRAEYRPPWNRS